ncbi:MAG: tail fiber domain-containing protein [Candidatus Pacebacteria bacterium]|nr:tail fiber domain-containing protein [Candidatus Paceibacterota bacterium]
MSGSDTQIQFNNGGAFSASSAFTFSSSTQKLTVTNASTSNLSVLGSAVFASTSTTPITISSGSLSVPTNGNLQIALGGSGTALTIAGTGGTGNVLTANANTSGNSVSALGTMNAYYFNANKGPVTLSGSTIPPYQATFSEGVSGTSTITNGTSLANVEIAQPTFSAYLPTGASWNPLLISATTGAGYSGELVGALSHIVVSATTTFDNQAKGAVGFGSHVITNVNVGGVASGYGTTQFGMGSFFGENPWADCQSGSTYLHSCVGEEIDVALATSSSASNLSGLQIVLTNDHGSHGTNTDSLLTLSAQSGATAGVRNAISIGNYYSQWPVDSNGYLIQAQSGQNSGSYPTTAAGGIDLEQTNFTGSGATGGGFAFRSQNFEIDNTGGAQIGYGYLSSTSTGLSIDTTQYTLSGTPTVASGGSSYVSGTLASDAYGNIVQVTASGGTVTSVTVVKRGWVATLPGNPVSFTALTPAGGSLGTGLTLNESWTTSNTLLLNPTSGGNVGIGTTTPGSIFAIQNVGNFVASATSTLYNSLLIGGNLSLAGINNSILSTNANGQIVATTTIGVNSLSGVLSVANGGTGQALFGQGWISSNGTTLSASSSPTVNYLIATSTSVNSSLASGLTIGAGTSSSLTITGGTSAIVLQANNSASGGEIDINSKNGNQIVFNNQVKAPYFFTPGNTATLTGSTVPTTVGNFAQNLAGTTTITGNTWGANVKIGGATDNASLPNASGWDELLIAKNYGGSSFSGGRAGMLVQLNWNATSSVGGSENGLVGYGSKVISSVNAGGTASGFGTTQFGLGSLFGANPWCDLANGGTYYSQCIGEEIDGAVQAGASTGRFVLQQLVLTSDHATHGTNTDAMQLFAAQTGASAGVTNAIELGNYGSQWPVDSNGYLIQVQSGQNNSTVPSNAAGGIDFEQANFTGSGATGGGFAFRSQNFEIDNTGGAQIGYGYLSSTSTGLSIDTTEYTLSGTPTVASGGSTYNTGALASDGYGNIVRVTASAGVVTSVTVVKRGWTNTPPSNPVSFTDLTPSNNTLGSGLTLNESWSQQTALLLNPTSGGNVGIGTTTPGSTLAIGSSTSFISLNNAATSTFGYGLNIQNGCFSVNGTCISTSGGASLSANNSWSGVQSFANASNTLTTLGTTWFSSLPSALLSTNANGQIGATTVSFPLQYSGSTLTLGFGTTTSNTWGGTQTFGTMTATGLATLQAGANIGTNASAQILQINGPAASNRDLRFSTANTGRWQIMLNGTAESGSNAGSDLDFTSFSDTGTTLGTAFELTRATGAAKFFDGLTVAGPTGLTVNSTTTLNGNLAIEAVNAQSEVWSGNTSSGPSVNPIYIQETHTGTTTGTANLNWLSIGDDEINASTSEVIGWQFNHNIGPNAVGTRNAMHVNLGQTATTTGIPFMTVANFFGQASYPDGGTGTTPGTAAGDLFGINPKVDLLSGATNFGQIVGEEIDIAAHASSSVMDVIGQQIVEDTGGVVHGARDDVGLSFNNASGVVGWNVGIGFGRAGGEWPIATSGTMIEAVPTNSAPVTVPGYLAQNGVDFREVDFGNGTGLAFASPGFQVNGTGATTIGTDMLSPTSTGLSIDAVNEYVSAVSISNSGASYQAGNSFVNGPDGGIYEVTSVNGSGNVTGLAIITPDYAPAGSLPSNPVSLTGSQGNGNLKVNLTWSIAKSILLNPTSGGNVGIGTTSPSHKLSIWGAGTNGFFGVSSSTSGDIFNINPLGNVGIGTSSPYGLLSITNSASTAAGTPLFTVASTTGGTSTSTLFTIANNGDAFFPTVGGHVYLGAAGTGGGNNLAGANLGIMNVNGSATLAIGAGGAYTGSSAGSATVRLSGYTGTAPINAFISAAGSSLFQLGTINNFPVTFDASTTEVGRFSTNGNFGIGTTTPGSALAIGSSTSFISLNNAATSTFGYGLNIQNGCFSMNGTCINATGASSTLLIDTNTWNNLQTLSSGFIASASSTVIGNFNATGTISAATGNPAYLTFSGGASNATVQASGSGSTLVLKGQNNGSIILQPAANKNIIQFYDAANGASANYFQMRNGTTGNGPIINAIGTDPNVNANYWCQGACSHVFNNTLQAPTLYANSGTITYSGSSQSTSQYGLYVNQNLAGSTTAGNINANTVTINTDTAIPNSGNSVNWFQVGGNIGYQSWATSTAYALNAIVDWGGNTYKCTTAGTSASSGGPTGTGSSISDGTVVWAYQGPSWGGKRGALYVAANVRSQSSSATDANKQVQAAIFTQTVSANQGGTGTSNGATQGFFYGYAGQMWAYSGATNLSGVVGNETDVGIFSGASAGQRTGIQVIAYGDNQGAQYDVGYKLGANKSGLNPSTQQAPGFKVGLGLSMGAIDPNGSIISYLTPIAGQLSGGTLAEPAPKLAYGIDLNPYLISSAAFRSANGFSIDGNGAVNVGSVKLSATSTGASLDTVGAVITGITLNTSNTGYVVGDQLSGPYGSIITITSVDGSGHITGFSVNEYGGTTLSNPSTTGVTFTGGTGAGATFNLTFSTNKTLLLNPTSGGNVGIGTTTPSSRLSVWGSDAASSTPAFNVINSASTTEFAVFDGGNAQLAGTLSQNSDQRLKTNVQPLTASSSLSFINQLNPVSFNWIDPNRGTQTQFGFIAQEVWNVFPNLISTTSPTALTPNGTLSLNYIGLISPIIAAIQELSREITTIENTLTGFATVFHTQELCVGNTCVNQEQLAALLAAAQAAQTAQQGGNSSASATVSSSSTAPVIQINGNNPATVQIGATYNDLGATITGPVGDLNLDIHTFVNGIKSEPVQIDTTQVATDTIDYVVTDQNGITSTSTRTVIVAAPQPIVTTSSASSTDATSTDIQTPPDTSASSTAATSTQQ